MTEPANDPLGSLISLLTDVLSDVRQGRLLSLERMGEEFERLYDAVQQQTTEDYDRSRYRARLKRLNALRAHLAEEVQNVRGVTLNKLGNVTLGRRGLKAYKETISDPNSRVKRGEG